MAKKRVHEIAKERGISSKEVLAKLQGAGFDVKAAASSVDERDIATAFDGGARRDAPTPGAPGDGTAAEASTGGGAAAATAAPEPSSEPAEAPAPPSEAPQNGGSGGGSGAGRAARPGRSGRLGEGGPGGGRRRRVVIDSQASRPRGAAPPPPQRPPRRGRRRRTPWVEPDFSQQEEEPQELPATSVDSGATVREVAESFGVPAPEVIKKLMAHGEMATLTQTLTDEAIVTLADEFDKKVEIVHAAQEVPEEPAVEDPEEALSERPPVVTVMGHVDHGKTSLLDAIRETEVAAGEAGGITQHIGAYQVHHDGHVITFLDTPGHEAFTAMRARGAQVTDIAVIVVAADDGVKPQTREAVDHAKAAEVPMLVAVNKIDKEGAQPDRVRTEMTQLGLQPEEWGGETMFVDVSAKAKTNLDDLLESILLLAEVEELSANPNVEASGVVIESKLDPGRGAVVTVLVNRGTLKVGDAVVAGAHWGRVRALHDYKGRKVKDAGPSEPVEVLGFDTVPEAGEYVRVVENDRRARQLANERGFRLKSEAQARRSGKKRSLETIFDDARGGMLQDLNLVLKADVSGSLEAFEDEIAKLPQSEVQVQIVLSGVGGITESDIMLASASDAVVMGFNVRPVGEARALAEREGVEIRTYAVIYRAIDELRDAMQGLLAPEEVEETVGTVEVRA